MAASPPADNLPLPPLPDEKFGVISIDIPWHFRSRAPTQNHHISRSPQRHYPTMDLEHAEQLPIKHLASPKPMSSFGSTARWWCQASPNAFSAPGGSVPRRRRSDCIRRTRISECSRSTEKHTSE